MFLAFKRNKMVEVNETVLRGEIRKLLEREEGLTPRILKQKVQHNLGIQDMEQYKAIFKVPTLSLPTEQCLLLKRSAMYGPLKVSSRDDLSLEVSRLD